jgi:acyl transferase domain-containing protein
MDQLRQLEDLIERYEARIEEAMRPFAEAERRLMTIPGVGRQAAEVIVAEIGADMTRFATAGHLASWSGLCPGNNESAGKLRTNRTTKGSQWLRTTLVQVAWAASHTQEDDLRRDLPQVDQAVRKEEGADCGGPQDLGTRPLLAQERDRLSGETTSGGGCVNLRLADRGIFRATQPRCRTGLP